MESLSRSGLEVEALSLASDEGPDHVLSASPDARDQGGEAL